MRNQAGDTLTSLNDRPAALVRRLAGQGVLFPTLHQCEEIGRALGELHVLGQSYAGHCDNSRGPDWRHETAMAVLPKADEDAAELIRDELNAQAALDLAALPQG